MSEITIVPHGITQLHTDAIVNAANSGLWAGGGVCGAIFEAAGKEKLQIACNKIGGCPEGSAVITPAFDLDSKYIIHAVGPRWIDGYEGEPEKLYGAYTKSLELAMANDCSTIGFPLISTGIFGYPKSEGWKVALQAVMDFIDKNRYYDIHVYFAVPNDETRAMGQEILKKLQSQNI